ncbi:uncharacterized protein ACJ7VT_011520 [Polymixia lowei]
MSPDGHCGSMMSWRSLPYLFYLVLLARIEPARAGCKDSIEKGSLLQEKMFMPNYYMVQLHTRQNVTEDNAVILERSLKEWCCGYQNKTNICHMYSDCYKKETPELACETKQKEVAPLNMYVVSLSEFNCMMAHEKNVKKSEYYPESGYLDNCRTSEYALCCLLVCLSLCISLSLPLSLSSVEVSGFHEVCLQCVFHVKGQIRDCDHVTF